MVDAWCMLVRVIGTGFLCRLFVQVVIGYWYRFTVTG
jgi:hypothetical protein